MVAWHIDRTQTAEVINYSSKVLVDLRSCWLKDIEFTILLLNQFLEDMESYMNVNVKEFCLKIIILIILRTFWKKLATMRVNDWKIMKKLIRCQLY